MPNQQEVFTKRASEWLLIYSLPFWYGAITRLPFIYFVIHMRYQFDLDWDLIGCFVGSYQASRALTGIATVFLPAPVTHFIGTAIALAGNLLVLVSNKEDQIPFLVGTIAIGFAETLACMQTYVKGYYSDDLDLLGHKLKVQYATVCIGVTFTFAVGGAVYEFMGINGIAVFGSIASLMELLSLIAYFVLASKLDSALTSAKEDGSEKDHESENASSLPTETEESSRASASILFPRIAHNLVAYATDDEDSFAPSEADLEEDQARSLTEEDLEQMADYFSKSSARPNYITYVLCFTFGMEAITIGYNLAVSPVYITEQFSKSTGVIGIILAAGAAFGTLISIGMTLSKGGKKFVDKWLPDPYGFLFGMAGISFAVLLAAVPLFPVHLTGLLFLMGFNDYAAILLNEMQGSVTSSEAYRTIAPKGQIVRRCGNVITAITGPILYAVLPSLPYIVAGGVTATWTVVLVIVIRHRMKTNTKIILDIKEKEGLGGSEEDVTGMTFARQEVLARLINRHFNARKEDVLKKMDMSRTSRLYDLSEGDYTEHQV